MLTKNIVLLMSILFTTSSFADLTLFQQYPAKFYYGKPKVLILDTDSRTYKTLLKQMTQKPINFAGAYVAETFGCGGGCEGLLIYNQRSGRGLLMKDHFRDCYHEKQGYIGVSILTDRNSKLIIATGSRKGEPHLCEEVHYLIEKDQVKQIKQKWLYR